jgi:cysteine-rich repeat protein
MGDLDGDGTTEIVATAAGDDDGGPDRGAANVLFMDGAAIVCGNAIADPVEECDDGNTADFDGCTATCESEDLLEIFGAAGSPGQFSVTIDGVSLDVGLVAGDSPILIAQLVATAINGDPTLSAQGTTAQAVGSKVYSNGTFTAVASGVSGISASFAPGRVVAEQKISDTQGGFTGGLVDGDHFGNVAATLGDVDGDGISDFAAGASFAGLSGPARGALWIMFLNADGSVKGQQKVDDLEGGFTGVLEDGDHFGSAAAPLGDLDGDGVVDVAVGARKDDDGGSDRGAVWILFLNADGTVKSHQKISSTDGGFTGTLDNFDYFGIATASLGDLDEDGVTDLAVGAFNDDDGAPQSGALWILFLNSDGTVKAHQKISNTQGGFGGTVGQNDFFGGAVARLGDLDGDGIDDLAVGSARDDDGGPARGAVWILFMNTDGTVKSEQKISATEGGFSGLLDDEDDFGVSTSSLGDLDGDGVPDVAVGARDDDDNVSQTGAVWILFLNADGTVKRYQKISAIQGGLIGDIYVGDLFGKSTALLGDLNGDGTKELAVGAIGDDDGGVDRGAVWILSLDGVKVAVCGDAETFFPETCDDGNLVSGDGCFSTCQVEDELVISGVAAGGSIEILVSGNSVLISTLAGESAADVVTNLSTALNADVSLQSIAVSSVDLAERLVTNGTIDSIANSDPGLVFVPEPGVGFMLSVGALGIAGLRRIGRRGR